MKRRILVSGTLAALGGCLSLGKSENKQGETPHTTTETTSTVRGHEPTTTEITTGSEIQTQTNTELETSVEETTTQSANPLPDDAPNVKFSFDYSTTREELTVTHAEGDPIVDEGTDSLSIDLVENQTTYFWVWDRADRTLTDFPVKKGDSVTVDVPPGEHVKIHWFNDELEGWALAEYEVP